MNIEVVWEKVKQYEGEKFYTKTGKPFTYEICGNTLIIKDRKNAKTTKSSIEKALTIQNPTPSRIEDEGIWAPAYIYGIITDKKIRNL